MSITTISSFKEKFHNSDFFKRKYREDIISTFVISGLVLLAMVLLGYIRLNILIVPIYTIVVYGLAFWAEKSGNRKISLLLNNFGALIILYIAIVFPDVRLESLILVSFAISGLVYNRSERGMRNLFNFYLAAFFLLQVYETYFFWNVTPAENYRFFNTIILFAGVLTIISSIIVFAQTYSFFIEELLKQERRLIGMQHQYQNLFDNSFDAIFVYDHEKGRIENSNQAFDEMFKINLNGKARSLNGSQNVMEKPGIEFSDLSNRLGNYIHEAKKIHKAKRFEFRHKRLNGESFESETTLIPIHTDTDKLIVLVKDISREKQQQRLINKQMRDLNVKNKELQRYIHSNLQLENFAYIASHDLKAPMRTIVSFAQLLQRSLGDRLNCQEREYLNFVISGTKNLKDLTNDLLTFSRVNTTRRVIEAINVELMLKGICFDLNSNIKEKNALIRFENLPEVIQADKVKLRLLFQNFMTNSLKFVSPGKQPLIVIRGSETETCWQFSIRDNGIGIREEFKEKIFLLFKRLHNQSEYEGTGIGLALCKKLVEQHEGEIRLYSKPGEGSEFVFTIKKNLR